MVEYYNDNDEEVVEVISKCWADNCSDKTIIYWMHERCGEKLYINCKGEIICYKCLIRSKFCNWHCNCGSHSLFLGPRFTSKEMINRFLEYYNSYYNSECHHNILRDFLFRLTVNLFSQYYNTD